MFEGVRVSLRVFVHSYVCVLCARSCVAACMFGWGVIPLYRCEVVHVCGEGGVWLCVSLCVCFRVCRGEMPAGKGQPPGAAEAVRVAQAAGNLERYYRYHC